MGAWSMWVSSTMISVSTICKTRSVFSTCFQFFVSTSSTIRVLRNLIVTNEQKSMSYSFIHQKLRARRSKGLLPQDRGLSHHIYVSSDCNFNWNIPWVTTTSAVQILNTRLRFRSRTASLVCLFSRRRGMGLKMLKGPPQRKSIGNHEHGKPQSC